MIDTLKKTARGAVDALLERGADKANVRVAHTVTQEFNVDGGEFSLFRTLFDKSLSMECIREGRRGTISQNRYDEKAVTDGAAACIEAAASATPDENWDVAPLSQNEDFELGEFTPDLDKLFFRCREFMDELGKRFPKIIMEQMIVSHKQVCSVRANSRGVLFATREGCYNVDLMFSGHEGDKASSFFGSGVVTGDLSRPFMELGSVARDLGDVEKQIETEGVSGKFTGTMILTPGCTMSLFMSLISDFAGEQGLLSGTSPWKDKLGQKVADERITMSFAPLDERIVCGSRYTREGFRAENFDIIKDGRLNAFYLSQYGSNKLKLPRGKNDAMNLIIAPGDKSLDEIVASVDRGIIVGRFSGGNPSSNGDFSGVAKNSFLIENGKLGPALSETMISGNMAEMLNSLRAVSREQVLDGMTALPYLAFDGITISGK